MIVMIKTLVIVLCTVLLTSSCSLYRVNFEEVTDNYYVPKSPENVQVVEQLTQPHEIIGYITVNTERNQEMEDILYRMKTVAARLGGDAITNIQSNATGSWKKFPAQKFIGNAYVRANYSATVIAFPE
jgi:K+/H+ antiporter YhaU regulatory subunit KhtT